MGDGPFLASSLPAGSRFAGRYRIEAPLGRGGMGAVYAAHDEHVGDRVALKVLSRDRVTEKDVARFRREVRLARRISHPNVARVHDLGLWGDVHFLTMELVEGRTLRELLAVSGAFDPGRVAAVGVDLASALTAVHAAGVVHRDLKPSNALVDPRGRVVLVDFGIARPPQGERGTQTGSLGTPLYMAPEQVLGEPVGTASDLYALGLILYEVATGEAAFRGDTAAAIALVRVHRDVPDPRGLAPDLPREVAEVIVACCARDPAQRVGSAAEVVERLLPLAESVPRPSSAVGSASLPLSGGPDSAITTAVERLRTERTLAVLPLRHVGTMDHQHFGEALTFELVDLLSRTRGLRVLGAGATAAFGERRDPRVVGGELGADVVVDGTVQTTPGRVRVSMRLCSSESGVQLWSERFEGEVVDILDLQDTMARRIAESLRLGLTTSGSDSGAPEEAVELYLRARHELRREQFSGSGGAVALLSRAIEAAPSFRPAISAHAIACVRAWFIPGLAGEEDWESLAHASVERALELAPDVAETRLAAAMLAVQDGEPRAAGEHLEEALQVAPTCAEAHEYRGRLFCEAGRPDEGIPHLRLALELDPQLLRVLGDIARTHALRGEWAACDAAVDDLEGRTSPGYLPMLRERLRTGAWRGDRAAVERVLEALGEEDRPDRRMMRVYGEAILGRVSLGEATAPFADLVAATKNRRFVTFVHQLLCEMHASAGDEDGALRELRASVDGNLLDSLWLDYCPLLAGLRERDAFVELRRSVRARAALVFGD